MESLSEKLESMAGPEEHLVAQCSLEVEVAHTLVDSARTYAAAAVSDSTRRAYLSAWKKFLVFCSSVGADALPASPGLVAVYISNRADSGRKVSTITSDLAAIAAAHRAARLESPTRSSQVATVLRGIKNTIGVRPVQKAALGIMDIRRLVAVLDQESVRGTRDNLILVLGFAAGLRRSELVALDVTDIDVVEHGLRVLIRRSKTDQQGDGRVVPVPWGSGRTCPVRCYRSWLSTAGITEGAVFRTIGNGDRLLSSRMSSRAVARCLKKLAAEVGMDPSGVSGHSLRAGFCTEAARAGASNRQIMRVTGHKSSIMVDRYVREGRLWDDNATSMVGL